MPSPIQPLASLACAETGALHGLRLDQHRRITGVNRPPSLARWRAGAARAGAGHAGQVVGTAAGHLRAPLDVDRAGSRRCPGGRVVTRSAADRRRPRSTTCRPRRPAGNPLVVGHRKLRRARTAVRAGLGFGVPDPSGQLLGTGRRPVRSSASGRDALGKSLLAHALEPAHRDAPRLVRAQQVVDRGLGLAPGTLAGADDVGHSRSGAGQSRDVSVPASGQRSPGLPGRWMNGEAGVTVRSDGPLLGYRSGPGLAGGASGGRDDERPARRRGPLVSAPTCVPAGALRRQLRDARLRDARLRDARLRGPAAPDQPAARVLAVVAMATPTMARNVSRRPPADQTRVPVISRR
jgi:hypothetical protein